MVANDWPPAVSAVIPDRVQEDRGCLGVSGKGCRECCHGHGVWTGSSRIMGHWGLEVGK